MALIIVINNKKNLSKITKFGSYSGAIYLFIYAAGFSYAYVTLGTATGALVLFASVQFTMLLKGWLYTIGSGALASGVGYSVWYAVLPR